MPISNTEDRPSAAADDFASRHVGPRGREVQEMLATLGLGSLEELVEQTVPASIRTRKPLDLPAPRGEKEILDDLRSLAAGNQVWRSFIGLGYHDTFTPPVIQRLILESPGWYTAYTPYQPEISQGRLEALLNFQTMVADLTGFAVANASLLDEATAAAEAMMLCLRVQRRPAGARTFVVSRDCHPQTVEVVKTRARPQGIDVVVADTDRLSFTGGIFGVLIQCPATDGRIADHAPLCARAHAAGVLVVAATDLLALTLLRPPGEFGADVAVGSSQRFGVPMGYGGPHAAFMATRRDYTRQLPGRLVGLTRDVHGDPAVRLALQTREQHIRREKATSNICTAQVLLAVMASMYGVYHGPEGLRRIALRLHGRTRLLARALEGAGCRVAPGLFFDTLKVLPASGTQADILAAAAARRINLRVYEDGALGIALGERASRQDLRDLVAVFGGDEQSLGEGDLALEEEPPGYPAPHARATSFMTHPVFHRHRSETEFLRYVHLLESRDLSLTTSMIPLGSCTMKLNAAAEMIPIGESGFAAPHPFIPPEQAGGYRTMIRRLSSWLADITGFSAVSFMPNAGAQGEYTGLLVIRAYLASRGQGNRNICLIPESAHGTNPASSVMAGLEAVVIACDRNGNIDGPDLRAKAGQHADRLAALMVTYPSTHGVFEETIQEVCAVVHDHGGQVYLDGANMNALVGLCRPGELGADVCHVNLHKTFCIPHGGGGPGVGPICVAAHLAPFLPGHPLARVGGEQGIGPVAAAPYGSPSILPISYAYIAMMGAVGLTRASQVAILNANYLARRLEPHFPLLYKGRNGLVAHECILDARPLRETAGIQVDDIARRLMDYGFHAPTMSWPVAGTLMVEPTESESLQELDRFCRAMIGIREEIRQIEEGRMDRQDNPLKNAPHTARALAREPWTRPYSRETAAFPAPWLREHKFWPVVGRIDHVHGDRHLVCTRTAAGP
ncbi:MAG: aminomethyl-transferring glycine dehydrogenase [Acidobacteriota bacterium]